MTTAEKAEIRQTVIEVLEEISDRSGPPDRLMLFLYQFIGDFKDFRREMLDFKANTEGRLGNIDGHLDNIDGRLDNIDGRLGNIDGRLNNIDGHLDNIDGRFDNVDGRLDNVEKNMFTKADWEREKLRLIEGIGVEFKRIVKEDLK
jgi:predicted nuclease with TOPRIM domain